MKKAKTKRKSVHQMEKQITYLKKKILGLKAKAEHLERAERDELAAARFVCEEAIEEKNQFRNFVIDIAMGAFDSSADNRDLLIRHAQSLIYWQKSVLRFKDQK